MTDFSGSAAWGEFLNGIKTKATRRQYVSRLTNFFETTGHGPDDFAALAEKDPKGAGRVITGYLAQVKRRVESGGLKTVSLPGYVTPIKFFADMNELPISAATWKKVWRTLPKASGARDRPPTADEIRQVLRDCDKRGRVLILVMAAGGVRVGAFSFPTASGKERPMQLRDFQPLDKDGNPTKERGDIVAVKLTVYPGETEQYTTFITPEAWNEIQDYMRDREKRGEKIGPQSPILRDKYLTVRTSHLGAAKDPRPLRSESIKTMVRDLIEKSGARPKIENGERRYEWKEAHGFRKYFENVAQRHMKYASAHILGGHISALNNKGVYDSWNEKELLADYLKAAPELTIFGENKPLAKAEEMDELRKRIEQLEADKERTARFVWDGGNLAMAERGYNVVRWDDLPLSVRHNVVTGESSMDDARQWAVAEMDRRQRAGKWFPPGEPTGTKPSEEK